MKCIILANGEMAYTRSISRIIRDAQLIICADGGARHLKALDIVPHVMIGDFDSIHKNDLDFFQKKGVKMISYPPQKDQTDSELCIDWAIENNATDITLLGMTGTRMDHTLANIFLLKKIAEKKIPARIINEHNEIHAVIKDLQINGNIGELLSLVPVTQKVTGVTVQGLEYPLENAVLHLGSSLGISNVFKQTRACVSIKDGMLIVIKSRD
ncbi:MAG: thiamine diphosphokinase [Proteobacteria bacterium]|nr:thiamine diphosphokinase [Pseudomonadota bacterium]MBU1389656.1 thiamine diphosphokinase [Pseudomonadota bacterium]MBU1542594.1 thiamine diphosphokinase [Pseudomonadota bacterium]MBU2483053.1 thiamine diphosphokinase [Pseudomonadota bacterium]